MKKKRMENAVNSLLISKKQIDSLKSERNTLIKFYEVVFFLIAFFI